MLAAILLVAAALRFYAIRHTGMYSIDEGRYLLDALAKSHELRGWAGIFMGKAGEAFGGREFLLSEYVPRMAATLETYGVFWPKTLFYYCAGGIMCFTGFTTWAGNATEAAFGLLSVAVFFFWMRRIAGPRAGLIAAAIMAISCFHVYQSRNSYPQCLPGCFALMAMACHARWSEERKSYGWLLAGGFSLGMAFWASYQATVVLPGLLITHALLCARETGWRRCIGLCLGGWTALGVGFLLAVAVAEASTYPSILLFRSQGLTYPHRTFLQMQWPRVTFHTSIHSHWSGLVIFPYLFWRFEGWGAAGMAAGLGVLSAALGLMGAFQRGPGAYRRWSYLLPGLLATYWVIAVKGMPAARPYIFLLPYWAGLFAVAVDAAWHTHAKRQSFVRAVLVALLAAGACSTLWNIREVLSIRSAYPEALAYVKSQGETRVCGVYPALLTCYAMEAGVEADDLNMEIATGETPPRFLAADSTRLHFGEYPDDLPMLPENAQPVRAFKQSFGRILLEAEYLPPFASPLQGIAYVRALELERARRIPVYDLAKTGYGNQRPAPPKPPGFMELR